jgi:hypothetical protein
MNTIRLSVLLFSAVLLLAGCKTSAPWTKPPTAVVSITVNGKTAKVPVTVARVLPNEHSVRGVKLIQAEQFAEALKELETGVAAKPSDWQARIALAALQEQKGLLPEAKQNYVIANMDKGATADENCLAGIRRIEAQLKGK